MNSIKTKLRRLTYRTRHDFLPIENIFLIACIVICLFCTVQSVIAMSKNWELTERLTAEYKNLELATIAAEAAELENEYYKTAEYQELLARHQLDKKLPGESMVVLPENSGAAMNKHQTPPRSEQIVELSNFEKWLKFLFPTY